MKFQYLARKAGKRLFTPQKMGFSGFEPLNGVQHGENPKCTCLHETASFEPWSNQT